MRCRPKEARKSSIWPIPLVSILYQMTTIMGSKAPKRVQGNLDSVISILDPPDSCARRTRVIYRTCPVAYEAAKHWICEIVSSFFLRQYMQSYEFQNVCYLPGNAPDCIIAAFCSWNLWPRRSEPFRYLSTHLITHPSSRETRDLVVKSLTQSSKHRWTSFEYICMRVS